jgi:hypothetical protein
VVVAFVDRVASRHSSGICAWVLDRTPPRETDHCAASVSKTGDDFNKAHNVRQSNGLRRSHSPFPVDKNRWFVAGGGVALQAIGEWNRKIRAQSRRPGRMDPDRRPRAVLHGSSVSQ